MLLWQNLSIISKRAVLCNIRNDVTSVTYKSQPQHQVFLFCHVHTIKLNTLKHNNEIHFTQKCLWEVKLKLLMYVFLWRTGVKSVRFAHLIRSMQLFLLLLISNFLCRRVICGCDSSSMEIKERTKKQILMLEISNFQFHLDYLYFFLAQEACAANIFCIIILIKNKNTIRISAKLYIDFRNRSVITNQNVMGV